MINFNHSQGFSLIEVLISLSILVTGLLGISTLQNEALIYTHTAFNDSQAQFLISDIIERIRANPSNSTYSISFSQSSPASPKDCNANSCSPNQMASWDISQWRESVEDNTFLPEGQGQINFNSADSSFEISIRYDWRPLGQNEVPGEQRTMTVKTRIE